MNHEDSTSNFQSVKWRLPLMVVAGLALLTGLWAGLVRLGWGLAPFQMALHGPLMISGFLGTLISLERAVALQKRLPYLAPILTAAGVVSVLSGLPDGFMRWLILSGSLVLLISFGAAYYRYFKFHIEWANLALLIGALAWSVGNLLWVSGFSLPTLLPWWLGFLVITIAGERLELSRVTLLTRVSLAAFVGSLSFFVSGMLVSLFALPLGLQISGVGLIALSLWLLSFDVARKTIRQKGLTRFVAACLLPGYGWLLTAGVLWLSWPTYFSGGPLYDAQLHLVLIGFVVSLIFGHALLIVPAIISTQIPYRPSLYVPLILLHSSLLLRVSGDLLFFPAIRAWGGLLNEVAILLFLGLMIYSGLAKAGRLSSVSF